MGAGLSNCVLLVVELVSRCGYMSGEDMLQCGEMSPWRETFAGSHNWPLSQVVHFVLRRPGDLQRWARLVSGLDAKCSARVALELRYVATDETVPTLARLGNVVQQLQWRVGREVSDQPGLTDVGLRGLAGLASLQSLNLSYCRAITNAGLESVSRLGSLQSLNLSYCSAITNAGLEYVSRLGFLQSLNLSGCNAITDAGLEYLSRFGSLQSLNLGGCRAITDAGLEYVSRLGSLQSLNLSGCNAITDAGAARLQAAVAARRSAFGAIPGRA